MKHIKTFGGHYVAGLSSILARNFLVFIMSITIAFITIVAFSIITNSSSVSAYTASIATDNSISLDVSPSGNGTSIKNSSINVQSDCRAGYNLTIATPQGSSLYKYTNGTQDGTASFTAVDGTSALSSSNNTNKWGYTLTSNPTSSTVFSPLSSTAVNLKTTSQTASPSADINDTFDINYGVKVDNTIVPGNYQMASHGAVVYYLTMDTTCTQYTVQFNPNGGTVTSGGSNPEQNIQEGEPTKLSSSESFKAPTTASYTDAGNNTINGQADKLWTFWGWNTSIDGTGDWYKDKEAVENLVSAGSTITLYAQWKQTTLADMTTSTPTGTEKVINHNEMQDMRPEVCYNSPITTAENAPAATLIDTRGKVTTGNNPESPESYTVSKLADGNCWMTTNLNLGRSGTDGPNGDGTVTLTSEDTDLADNTSFTIPAGDTTSYTATTRLAKIRLTNNSNTNANGTYYTWSAAVANTTSISTNPTTSICPKNWDLPTNYQYTNLSNASSYSSSNPPTNAPSSFLTGKFTNGATFYPSSSNYGFYWSSTSSSATAAYGARVTSSALSTSASTGTTNGGNKYYRKNIRCIASNGKVTINYDGNGTTEYPVTGTTASQTNVEINSTNTMANGFTRTGWAFKGWNTQPDGSGIAITAANASTTSLSSLGIAPGSTITLYAQWIPQYTITYVNNCMTYASANSACTQSVSDDTSTQSFNLDANGDGSDTLGAFNYNSWTMVGWKIQEWTTNANGTGNSYLSSSTFSVTSQAAGDGITLYAHWVPVYSIQYDGNGAQNPNGMGTLDTTTGVKSIRQINISEKDSILLLPSNFKRPGYGYAGWSTDPEAWAHFTDNDSTNEPIIYGPMETIEAPAYPANGTNTITMYAVWVPAERTNPSDPNSAPVYFQDWDDPLDSTDGCATLTKAVFDNDIPNEKEKIVVDKHGIIALTDKRDNQTYAVARLADNNCWTIENLRLDHEYTVGQNQNDSSVTNASLAQGYGGTTGVYGNFIGLAEPDPANAFGYTTSNSIYKSSADPPIDTFNPTAGTLEDISTASNPANRFPRYSRVNTSDLVDSTSYVMNYNNATSPTNDPSSGYYHTQNVYSYGNYYSWNAAMATTNHYVTPSSQDSNGKTSETVGTSLCPTGWHLPSSQNSTKEWGALSYNYGGSGGNQASTGELVSRRFRAFPNNIVYSGFAGNGAIGSRGGGGRYWSRSTNNSTNAYNLSIYRLNLSPSEHYAKQHGYSIRCLIAP